MNDTLHDNLESRLEALSRPPAGPTALWRAALEEHRAAPKRSVIACIIPWAGLAAAVVTLAFLILPSIQPARRPELAIVTENSAAEDQPALAELRTGFSSRGPVNSQEFDSRFPVDGFGPNQKAALSAPASAAIQTPARLRADAESPRLIARRAYLTLNVPDVREAFLKAQHIVNPALSEFIEESRLNGEGPAATADLTLRISASRLHAALEELRSLGVVASESAVGEDVTDQSIDLDARLRNERRIESELLELLDSRKDAPLADVMKLRESLSTVRAAIERLDAQRANLAATVELARILLILRPAPAAPPPPVEKGFINTLEDQLSLAWRDGLNRLTASLAGALELLVGRALTILVLLLLLPLGIGIARRLLRFASLEAPPRLSTR